MSHLDAHYQDAWLAELRRVLRPGGIVTLTVHGRNAFEKFLDTLPEDGSVRAFYSAELHSKGIVFVYQDQWSSVFPDFYHTTFHDVGYVFDHWTRFMDLRSYIPRGALDYQDMIVLQKPAGDVVASHAYRDYVADARAATNHFRELLNQAQTQSAALAEQQAQSAAALAELQAQFAATHAEVHALRTSTSWRVSAPVRALGHILRRRRSRSSA
jgi:hypothetical protein